MSTHFEKAVQLVGWHYIVQQWAWDHDFVMDRVKGFVWRQSVKGAPLRHDARHRLLHSYMRVNQRRRQIENYIQHQRREADKRVMRWKFWNQLLAPFMRDLNGWPLDIQAVGNGRKSWARS